MSLSLYHPQNDVFLYVLQLSVGHLCILRRAVALKLVAKSTSPDMTTVFHARPDDRFIEIQSNLRINKLHRTNQGSNFLGGSFSNRDNVRAQIQFRRERQPQHLKR